MFYLPVVLSSILVPYTIFNYTNATDIQKDALICLSPVGKFCALLTGTYKNIENMGQLRAWSDSDFPQEYLAMVSKELQYNAFRSLKAKYPTLNPEKILQVALPIVSDAQFEKLCEILANNNSYYQPMDLSDTIIKQTVINGGESLYVNHDEINDNINNILEKIPVWCGHIVKFIGTIVNTILVDSNMEQIVDGNSEQIADHVDKVNIIGLNDCSMKYNN